MNNEYKINDIIRKFSTINEAKIYIDTLVDDQKVIIPIKKNNKEKISGAVFLLVGLLMFFSIGIWYAGTEREKSQKNFNLSNHDTSKIQNTNDQLITKNDVENYYIDYRQVREDLRNRENYIVEGTGYEIMPDLGAFVNKGSDGYHEIILVKSDRSSILPVSMKVDCENYRFKIRKPNAVDYGDDFVTPNRGSNGEAFVALACRLPFAYMPG